MVPVGVWLLIALYEWKERALWLVSYGPALALPNPLAFQLGNQNFVQLVYRWSSD